MRRPKNMSENETFYWFMGEEPPSTGCWDWKAGVTKHGYGQFSMMIEGTQRNVRAHQASYRIFHGEIPQGLEVLHSCHRPVCVQPEHLSVGTHALNMQQSGEAGRGRSGAQKLTPRQVMEIRESSLTQASIASLYGISQSHVSRIRTGNRGHWRHIT